MARQRRMEFGGAAWVEIARVAGSLSREGFHHVADSADILERFLYRVALRPWGAISEAVRASGRASLMPRIMATYSNDPTMTGPLNGSVGRMRAYDLANQIMDQAVLYGLPWPG